MNINIYIINNNIWKTKINIILILIQRFLYLFNKYIVYKLAYVKNSDNNNYINYRFFIKGYNTYNNFLVEVNIFY